MIRPVLPLADFVNARCTHDELAREDLGELYTLYRLHAAQTNQGVMMFGRFCNEVVALPGVRKDLRVVNAVLGLKRVA